jgi:hypothetical protein
MITAKEAAAQARAARVFVPNPDTVREIEGSILRAVKKGAYDVEITLYYEDLKEGQTMDQLSRWVIEWLRGLGYTTGAYNYMHDVLPVSWEVEQ